MAGYMAMTFCGSHIGERPAAPDFGSDGLCRVRQKVRHETPATSLPRLALKTKVRTCLSGRSGHRRRGVSDPRGRGRGKIGESGRGVAHARSPSPRSVAAAVRAAQNAALAGNSFLGKTFNMLTGAGHVDRSLQGLEGGNSAPESAFPPSFPPFTPETGTAIQCPGCL